MAHVRDEVAPHAVDAMDLGDVVDEHRGAERQLVADERNRLELQHRPRWSEELQLALRRIAGTRVVEQLGDRAGSDRVGVTSLPIALGRRVAEDLASLGVDDDDPVAEIDERGGETIALGDRRFGVGSDLFELCIERRCSTLLAPKRTQPNLPVM